VSEEANISSLLAYLETPITLGIEIASKTAVESAWDPFEH